MSWISSTENEKWVTENAYSNDSGIEIVIGEPKGKPLYGFGTCLSELGLKAISNLPKEKKKLVYDDFFNEDACDFSFCRLPIGANDFAESWYSYNETENDYEMKHFSIERDRKYIIPAIKEAQKRREDIRFFASPWSPPTWMKFPKVYNHGRFVMTEENLKAYALYFRKYWEAYHEEGINVAQIHVQNEIFADQKFPSCVWSGADLTTFIADYLLDEIGDKAEVWFGTVNGPEDSHLLTSRHNQFLNLLMQNDKCRKNVKGASYQWAGKLGILQAEEDYPELDTINSEWECGDGENTWTYAMYGFEMFRHYFAHGARACVYWNIALDERGLSTWGWPQNSLVSVINGKDVVYNPDYYMVKHYSHFVKKGAVMLSTKSSFNTNVAVFKNPNGERVAVIMNPFDESKTVTIERKNYVLKPRSFNSIVL